MHSESATTVTPPRKNSLGKQTHLKALLQSDTNNHRPESPAILAPIPFIAADAREKLRSAIRRGNSYARTQFMRHNDGLFACCKPGEIATRTAVFVETLVPAGGNRRDFLFPSMLPARPAGGKCRQGNGAGNIIPAGGASSIIGRYDPSQECAAARCHADSPGSSDGRRVAGGGQKIPQTPRALTAQASIAPRTDTQRSSRDVGGASARRRIARAR